MNKQESITKEEIEDWEENNKVPSYVGKDGFVSKERYIKVELQKKQNKVELKDVKKVLKKWLELPDTKYIDLVLASYLATQADENPLWIFIKGSSSCGKSTIIEALDGIPHVRRVDTLTKNTLASGKLDKKGKKVKDLGEELQGKDTLLAFPDLACMKTLNSDEKKAIFGQLRNLYDEIIQKDTGNGISKKYDGCHVCLIAGTTPDIEKEFALANQLGTRQLTYKVYFPKSARRRAKQKVVNNMGKKKQRKSEVRNVIHQFLLTHNFNDVNIPVEIQEFCFDKADEISLMRATVTYEGRTGDLAGEVSEEEGFRVLTQLLLLYQALKSIDTNYRSRDFKKIVENLVRNSANPNRYRIYKELKDNPDTTYTINDLRKKLILGHKLIKRQLNVLYAMDIITLKETFDTYSNKTEKVEVQFKQ